MARLILSVMLLPFFMFGQNTNIIERSSMIFSGQELANIWGYASNGREYALVGASQGMIVVDVTDPELPVQITQIPGPSSSWREIKTYQHYAYVVSEGGGGLQIVDLTNLPGSNITSTTYWGDGPFSSFTRAHSLHIDEAEGYLYLYGCNGGGLFNGRPVIINLNNNPMVPNFVTDLPYIGYAHDGFANNDTLYAAHIYAGAVTIVDVSNKAAPVLLGAFNTPNNFTHNTWRYNNILLTTDETSNSFLTAFDILDPANPVELDKIQSNPGSNSIVHNTYVLNGYAVTSWYKDGVTVVDITRPANLVQVGNFDTYSGSGSGFEGCWGVYPYLPSGNLLISNITASPTIQDGEMKVLTPTYIRACHLEGTVTDASTGLPLAGAAMSLAGTTLSAVTPPNGQYKVGQVTPGTYTARFAKSGYQDFIATVTLTNGVLTIQNAPMQPIALPVELKNFDVNKISENSVELIWETGIETDNMGFEIQFQRGEYGDWQTAEFIAGRGNNSAYSQTLENLLPGQYYFRLRQIDLNGSESFSPIRALQLNRVC